MKQAAVRTERAVTNLLGATAALEDVAGDYVIERLVAALIERNPRALDHLNKQDGEGSVRLANALMDWRDLWETR